jgi:hypothetical protein
MINSSPLLWSGCPKGAGELERLKRTSRPIAVLSAPPSSHAISRMTCTVFLLSTKTGTRLPLVQWR